MSKQWWEPVRSDHVWCERLRKDYPHNAHMSDEQLRDEYADGREFAVTWDHVGDAYAQFEKLAEAYLKLKAKR